MLQRQIMFKQLQELQRRQQLQELGDVRNQDCLDQLSSLRQDSAVQFVNGAPVHDSQMFTVGNMQMMQQGGSSFYQDGLVHSQSHNHPLGPMGFSQPQFDIPLYGTPAPNTDMNLNLYPHLQRPSDNPANLWTKNNNSPLGMHPSAFASSFTSRQGNFSSDQTSMPDGSSLPNRACQDKDLFGQVPIQGLNNDLLSLNYPQQGVRHEDTRWLGIAQGKVSKVVMSQPAVSLDPLEQKILYNTEDNSWESFGGNSKVGTKGFECIAENPYMDTLPSIHSGSWSALMQSAVTETSSSDTVMQEEWSGLSFQNPEPSTENQPSSFIDCERPQNNWVDRNLQNVSSPCSEPEQLFQKSNMNYSSPGFNQSEYQYFNQKDEFQSVASHASVQHTTKNSSPLANYNSQLKHSTGGFQLIQPSSPSTNTLPAQYQKRLSGHEIRDTLWLPGSTSNSVSGCIQSGNMLELFNKDGISSYCTAGMELTSKVSSLNQLPLIDSFAKPCNTSYPESQGSGSSDAARTQSYSFSPGYSAAPSQANLQLRSANSGCPDFPQSVAVTQPSEEAVISQHVRFQTRITTPSSDINSRQYMSPSNPNRFSGSLFESPDSASSSLETSSGAPNDWPNQNSLRQERNVQGFGTHLGKSGYRERRSEKEITFNESSSEMHNRTPISRNIHTQETLRKYHSEAEGIVFGSLTNNTSQQPYNQAEQKDSETAAIPATDIRTFGHSLHKNVSQLHQLHSPRNDETEYSKKLPLKYDTNNYQAIAKARELLSNEQKSVVQEDLSGKASSAAYLQIFQQMEMFRQNDTQNHIVGNNEVSNVAHRSQNNLQMSQSWYKHYETLKNGLSIAKRQEDSLVTQVNSANTSQGSGIWPSSDVASKHLSPSSILPLDVTYQNLALANPMKRKIVANDMVPWHKEVNHEELRLHNISMAESEWAQASNRREEEAKNYAEIVEDVLPVAQTKRRLLFSTQLMQQIFRPAPAVLLFADASSNCDSVAYSAVRSALGDACNLTSKLRPVTTDILPNKLNTSKRTSACEFSKVVEGLISRVQKLEGDLSRLDQSSSILDIKIESQELEKFSTINRFAKFHVKAHQSTADPTSTVQTTIPQRYVTAFPLPRTLPEGLDCLSL